MWFVSSNSLITPSLWEESSFEVATAAAKTLGAPSAKATRETARAVACAAAQLARAHGAGPGPSAVHITALGVVVFASLVSLT